MHAQTQPAFTREFDQLQTGRFAAGDRQASRIPVVIQNRIWVAPQFKAPLGKGIGVAQRKTELQQIYAAHAHRIEAHDQLPHRERIARTHGHFNHHIGNERDRPLNSIEGARMLGSKRLLPIELHAEANLAQSAIAQLAQTFVVKEVAAGIQTNMGLRIQFARRIQERIYVALEQQWLAARDGQAVELRAARMGTSKLTSDIAPVREPIFIVFLIWIKTEIAMPRAFQRYEKRRRALAGATRHARR